MVFNRLGLGLAPCRCCIIVQIDYEPIHLLIHCEPRTGPDVNPGRGIYNSLGFTDHGRKAGAWDLWLDMRSRSGGRLVFPCGAAWFLVGQGAA